jgi:cytidyltransferase-like protein
VENGSKIIGIYGGGFKPPTKGHFEVVQQALKQFPEMDELLIYVGSGERDKVDQAESVLVWNIYKKHLPSKVSVESVKAPIGDIFKYAKDHPEEKIYFILGAREENEDDQTDITSRTKSVKEKYPNIEVKIITTPDSGISGTNARKALFQSRDEFFKYIPSVLSPVEKERVYTLLVPELISENASYAKDIDYKQYIKELTKDMIRKGMNITPLPKVIFKHSDINNAKDFFGKTAYYEPQSMSIVLYTEGRHPKDIVRSFAHEMIHHMQNVEDRLGDITTTNTQEDDRLNDLEAEANLKGTMTFRNWTDKMQEKKNKDPFGITAYALELARGLEEQEGSKYKIYVDMDGVLVDFDGGYEKLTGMTTRAADEKGPEFFWKPISKAGAKWWITLNWMSDGKQLWDYVKKYNPELLSAPSREEASRMGKRVWVKRELPGVKLILRSADKKQEFASPNSILIDDREKNIEQWKNAGGIGILHTDAASTIKKLKDLGL